MQTFRPFRATFQRQQKYYSEKRPCLQDKGSIFNLPRQIISYKQMLTISPQNTKPPIQSQHKIATDYQKNLKNNVKKHSTQIINKKAFQKIAHSFVQIDKGAKSSKQKIPRNKSHEQYPNKNLALDTLNILYRTIIQTKGSKRQKQTFELSAKRLPILQKPNFQSQNAKKMTQVFVRNSSFDKYKLNLTSITDQSRKKGLEKYKDLQDKMTGYQINEKQVEKSHLWGRKRRFQRNNLQSNVNEIVPWNMIEGNHQMELFS